MIENAIKQIQRYSWTLLVLILLLGWFSTTLMLITLVCMLGPIVFSFHYGRAWCGNFCPRGSLNNYILKAISPRKAIPVYLKRPFLRIAVFVLLMSLFAYSIIQTQGSITGIGIAFIKMMTLTTIIEICMGIFIHHNSWCYICPMGSAAGLVSKLKSKTNGNIIFTKDCRACNKCVDDCPMQINIPQHESIGRVTSSDCIKCRSCVGSCPNKVLEWDME